MVAFVPISPMVARRLLANVSADDHDALLSDFVEAGLIRAYARVIETGLEGGSGIEVRDAQIPRDLWKRVVSEGRVEQLLATSSVKLEDGQINSLPAVTITGVRFNEANVRDVAAQHGDALPSEPDPTPLAKPEKAKPSAQAMPADVSGRQGPVAVEPAPERKARAGLPDGAVMVSVKDAMDILDVSRGTIGC